MVVGATVFVDAIRALADAEADQARVSVTLVGFVTGFELVVLAWSAARRGMSDAVVAAVVGSYAYNATVTLGAAAVVRPLAVRDAGLLRPSMAAMVLALAAVLVLAARRGALSRRAGVGLLLAYPVFVGVVLLV
jgi:cation:H+ antiporter